MVFNIEEGVELKVVRKPNGAPGIDDAVCEIRATDGTALMKGVCVLVRETANRLGMTKHEIICRLAVTLLGLPETEVPEC